MTLNGASGAPAHMQIVPAVDCDGAVQRVVRPGRELRLAMRLLIGQPKRLTMQTRSRPGCRSGARYSTRLLIKQTNRSASTLA